MEKASSEAALKESLWWMQRWISGSMRDPEWDESWLEQVKSVGPAFEIIQREIGNAKSINQTLWRYLALSKKQLRQLRATNALPVNPENPFQSFTTSAELAEEIGSELVRDGEVHIIVATQPDPRNVMFGMADLKADRRASQSLMGLEDWHGQDEVIVRVTEPLPIIDVQRMNPNFNSVDIWESVETGTEMILWHGGRSVESDYLEVKAHKKGRWEHGPGLYLTTRRETAARYAKGGGKLYRITVRIGQDAENCIIPIDDAIEFVKRNVVRRLHAVMISDLQQNLERVGALRAIVLVNLCLNHEAIPNSKTDRLRQFLIDHGVDQIMVNGYGGRGDETIVVVVNPRIIKKVEVLSGKRAQSR